MNFRSIGHVDKKRNIRAWIEFRSNNKLKFYQFISSLNDAVSKVCRIDSNYLDDAALDILENKNKDFSETYLDTFSYKILNKLDMVEELGLDILDYIKILPLSELDYESNDYVKYYSPIFEY